MKQRRRRNKKCKVFHIVYGRRVKADSKWWHFYGFCRYKILTSFDIGPNDWYFDYVMELSSEGIISGYGDGLFYPKDDVSNGMALKLIMTAAYDGHLKILQKPIGPAFQTR